MSQFTQNIWELRKDETLLGILEDCNQGWPWVIGHFEASPEFEAYRPLFAEELRLLDQDNFNPAAWEQAYRKIADLRLTLQPQSEAEFAKPVLFHIRGDQVWFRQGKIG